MRKRTILVTSYLLICMCAMSQDNQTNPFPSIIPPSPELASLADVSTITAKNYTGAATVQIPLYELKVGTIKLPISLAYGTNGVKVNDIPTRVGLGWTLFAGGSITKIVHDEEDDNPSTIPLVAANIYNHDQAFLDYLNFANMDNYDTETDEYAYNVNGMTGKFFVDGNGDVQLANKSEIKIVKLGLNGGFVLTTGDGTRYLFDFNKETAYDVKLNGQTRGNELKTTAFFLRQIISQEGDYIQFGYEPIHLRNFLGISQSVLLMRKAIFTPQFPQQCPICTDPGIVTQGGDNQIDYNTYYLSDITCSNGINVDLGYQTRPDDVQDKRLTNLNVFIADANGFTQYLKRYNFSYTDYPIAGDHQLRFYLTSLTSIANPVEGQGEPERLVHQFEYYNPAGLPSQRSFAQDYFGYANGRSNFYFWPKPLGEDLYHYADEGANRDPDFTYGIFGALKKVIYPTGGSQEFIYEPHTMKTSRVDSSASFAYLYTGGAGYDDPVTVTKNFTMSTNLGLIRINYTTHQNPGGPLPGQPGYWEAGDGKIISYLWIKKLDGTVVYQTHHLENTTTYLYSSLALNTTYQIVLTVKGASYRSDVEIRYNSTTQISYHNTAGCGIRVKQIKAFDPVTQKTNSKFYTYASLSEVMEQGIHTVQGCNNNTIDLPLPEYFSSGIGALSTVNAEFYPKGGVCIIGMLGSQPLAFPFQYIEKCPNFIRCASSSVSGGYSFGGSPIAYTNIIESDDENLLHGGTEHIYNSNYDNQNVLPILGYPVHADIGFGYYMDGIEIKTTVFKRGQTNFIILREDESIYSYDGRVFSNVENYMTTRRYTPPEASYNVSYSDMIAGDDIGGYNLTATWCHLDTKISRYFDENGANPVIQTVNYIYDNTDHCQPTQIITTNSKQETITKQLLYPADYAPAFPYQDMIDKNIVTPVLAETTFKGDANSPDVLSATYTNYDAWGGGVLTPITFYKPVSMTNRKAAGPRQEQVHFNHYDVHGNPISLTKYDGIPTCYLWNYKSSLPVAEVKNIIESRGDMFAYTSFEGDDPGGWTFSTHGNFYLTGITGSRSFGGAVSKNINDAKYTVTAWAQAEITVNNNLGTAITTKQGWTLYEWHIAGVTSVVVNGPHIDEVRLYPEHASMITYTYMPEIGISSSCDENNNIQYYEYDAFNRLQRLRDIDRNVLKQYEYKYNNNVTTCTNTNPDWQLNGNTRCVQVAADHNNYNGNLEQEAIDRNPCSATYQQSQWTYYGTSPTCTHIDNCTGPDQRVINGVCTTGTKVLISSDCVNGTCTCAFYYIWCDGYRTHPFTEINTTSCPSTNANPE